jgi:NADH-quinone oxidoreductase subunit J
VSATAAAGAVNAVMIVLALVGAVVAVGMKNIFHNILGFAVAMLGVAGLFLGLGADFVAAVFVLVYVGAVAIAMVYAVMLSQPLDQPPAPRSVAKIVASIVVAGAAGAALWTVMRTAVWPAAAWGARATAADVGRRFLSDYVLAFELISVLLLVAMMGAVMVARRSGAAGRGSW